MSSFSVHHQQLIDAAVTTTRVSDELTQAQARLDARATLTGRPTPSCSPASSRCVRR